MYIFFFSVLPINKSNAKPPFMSFFHFEECKDTIITDKMTKFNNKVSRAETQYLYPKSTQINIIRQKVY